IEMERPEDAGGDHCHQQRAVDKDGGVIEDLAADPQIERQGEGQRRHDDVVAIGDPAMLQADAHHRAAALNSWENTAGALRTCRRMYRATVFTSPSGAP